MWTAEYPGTTLRGGGASRVFNRVLFLARGVSSLIITASRPLLAVVGGNFKKIDKEGVTMMKQMLVCDECGYRQDYDSTIACPVCAAMLRRVITNDA